jgi:uncharacterized protein (DUF1778 family)
MAKKLGTHANRPFKRRKALRDLKQDLIQIRVTSEQRQILKDAADRSGLDLSSWMRMVGLKAASAENR